ncbi:MAG TPA: glycosyltransferase family 9 protein [Holophagaceae bacterium]|nr:glycosyltransferase family 9 protein [Holophagaceae bacterium]
MSPMKDPESILLLRSDAIGDHVLASGLLPLFRERWPQADITILCPQQVQDLFGACPHVHRVIPFKPVRLSRVRYRAGLAWTLRRKVDLAVNTVFSRDSVVDRVARLVRAERFVAFRGDTCNQEPSQLRANDSAYTELVEVPPVPMHALDRLAHLAAHLGLQGPVEPRAWISPEDEARAASLLSPLPPGRDRIAFFPGAGTPIRHYARYAEALRAFLAGHPAAVVALGAASDRAMAEEILSGLPGTPTLNLCGGTTLREAAAVIRRSRMGMGAETGLAHLAWALGIPHAVIVGGGHFGRFMPRSSLTSTACLPLTCAGCDWQCRFERPHCIQDLPPAVLAEAMAAAWGSASVRPRLFLPEPSPLPSLACPPPPLPGGLEAATIRVRIPA